MANLFNDIGVGANSGFVQPMENRETIDYLKDVRTQLRETMLAHYEPSKLKTQVEFEAICLKHLDNLTTENGENIIRIKARIPVIHNMLPIPKDEKDFHKMSLYPTFIGVASDFNPRVTPRSVSPGTRMIVAFENQENFGGPHIKTIFNITNVTAAGLAKQRRKRTRRPRGARPFPKRSDGTEFKKCKDVPSTGKIAGARQQAKHLVWSPTQRAEVEAKYPGKEGLTRCTNITAHGIPKLINCWSSRKPIAQTATNLRLQVAHGIADDFIALLKECMKLQIHKPNVAGITDHVFGTCGGWAKGPQQRKEFCKAGFLSFHAIGRAFDLATQSGMFYPPTDTRTQFLVTLSDAPNQTETDFRNTYGPAFFDQVLNKDGTRKKDSSGRFIKGAGLGKFHVWMKVDDTSAPKVKLWVAHAKVGGGGIAPPGFNMNTFVEWEGHAVSFTKLAATHGFLPIRAYREYRKGDHRRRVLGGNPNKNEWHHFQTFKGLVKGVTKWGDEVLRAGYSLGGRHGLLEAYGGRSQSLSTNPGTEISNWDFYKDAIFTGTRWRF
jgi:hypothetical protein